MQNYLSMHAHQSAHQSTNPFPTTPPCPLASSDETCAICLPRPPSGERVGVRGHPTRLTPSCPTIIATVVVVAKNRTTISPSPGGDLSRSGSGERNQPEGGGPRGPSERVRASQRRGLSRRSAAKADEGELSLAEVRGSDYDQETNPKIHQSTRPYRARPPSPRTSSDETCAIRLPRPLRGRGPG
jgi:hypothetical protein